MEGHRLAEKIYKQMVFYIFLYICVDLKLSLLYNIVLNKSIKRIRTVCRTNCRGHEGTSESVRALRNVLCCVTSISVSSPDMDQRFRFKP